MEYLNNSNYKNSKTLGYSLMWNVNPNLYSRYNPMSWVIESLAFIVRGTLHKIYIN